VTEVFCPSEILMNGVMAKMKNLIQHHSGYFSNMGLG